MRLFRRRPDPLVCQEFVELVTDYLEDALPKDERRRFEHHVHQCDGCDSYFQQIKVTVSSLAALPPEPPADPETREHLLRAFRELRGSS